LNRLFQYIYNLFYFESNKLIRHKDKTKLGKDDLLAPPKLVLDSRDELELSLSSNFELIRSLLNPHRNLILFGMLHSVGRLIFSLSGPIVIYYLTQALAESTFGYGLIVGLATLFSAISVCGGVVMNMGFYLDFLLFQNYQSTLSRLLFNKILHGDSAKERGKVLNLLSSDVQSISNLGYLINDTFYLIILVLSVTIALFVVVGSAAISAILTAIVMGFLMFKVKNKFSRLDNEIVISRDKRVSHLNMSIKGIREVKYSGLAKIIFEQAKLNRKIEVTSLIEKAKATALSTVLFASSITIIAAITFGTYIYTGHKLNAFTTFTTLSLLMILEIPLAQITFLLSDFASIQVSSQRIRDFFNNVSENEDYFNPQEMYKSGESVAVIGKVGSGKTTLLKKIANREIPIYGQKPFIFNDTLENNLTLGAEIERDKVNQAIDLACLGRDLAVMKGGLFAELGEEGYNLSGGQKQRLALARGVLFPSEIILLDNPCSSIDQDTENTIYKNLIFGHWREKTRVVATNRLKFLDRFDRIILLEDGVIKLNGSYKELKDHPSLIELISSETFSSQVTENEIEGDRSDDSNGKIKSDEFKQSGRVSKNLFLKYFSRMSRHHLAQKFIFLILLMLAVSLPFAQNLWLAEWSEGKLEITNYKYLPFVIYLILAVIGYLFVYAQRRVWFQGAANATQEIHDDSLKGLIFAPLKFFEENSSGRILNRFTKDLGVIDKEIGENFESTLRVVAHVVVNLIFLFFTIPVLVVTLVPVLFMYYIVQLNYRSVAREVKRITQISYGPVVEVVKECLEGKNEILSYHREEWFKNRFSNRLVDYQRADRSREMLDRWFSVRVPLLSGLITLVVTGGILYIEQKGHISASLVGLILTYLIGFWPLLNWSVRASVSLENNMTSVERLDEYSLLEPELLDSVINDPNQELADQMIVFKNITVRYRENLPVVLDSLNLEILRGEHIAIVGRTGSGKSTLINALVGLVPYEKGEIWLDGFELRQKGLSIIRSEVAVISQNFTVFEDTLRFNLDPHRLFDDETLLNSIKKVQLLNWFNTLKAGLNTKIDEENNLSDGEKQLLCLARLLLRGPKVVVLDEATSNIDAVTINRIHNILKKQWSEITVLAISHFSAALKDFDRVIQVENGKIKTIKQ
jgi:ABC-type multidrug transport system fused ATPase/permease subunit